MTLNQYLLNNPIAQRLLRVVADKMVSPCKRCGNNLPRKGQDWFKDLMQISTGQMSGDDANFGEDFFWQLIEGDWAQVKFTCKDCLKLELDEFNKWLQENKID